MKLVTVATRSEDYFPVLQDGSARLGWDLVVLGWGQRWRGFAWRWSLLKAYLVTLPPDEVVVWCDAYDVFPVAPPEKVAARFRDFGKPMVMSVENPDVSLAEVYMKRRMFGKRCRPDVFVNGGLYMGTVWALLEMMRVLETAIGFREGDDDQRLLNKLCRTSFMRHVAFDRGSRIFFNFDSDMTNPALYDTCFIHGPGHRDLRAVASMYGYTPPPRRSTPSMSYIVRWWNQFGVVMFPEYLAGAALVGVCAYLIYRALRKK